MAANVQVTVSRDAVLLMQGWIAAKRPTGEWDPWFLVKFIEALEEAADNGAHD